MRMRNSVTRMHPISPLALTDQQLRQVMDAAKPLQPRERSAFLAELANTANGEIRDGALHRMMREILSRHFDPPLDAA